MKKIYNFVKKPFAIAVVACASLLSIGAGIPDREVIFGPSLARGGGILHHYSTFTYYHTREVHQHIVSLTGQNPIGMPNHLTGHTCGINAGICIIGAYNKIFPELMPRFNAVRYFMGNPRWAGGNTPEFRSYATELFNAMGGNPMGTTTSQWFGGMNQMVNRAGRSFTTQSMMQGGQLNLNALKDQIQQNRYAAIFMNGLFNTADLVPQSQYSRDRISITIRGGNHIMPVYGFKTITYRDAQGQIIRVKNLLYVVPGIGPPRALLYLNNYISIYNTHITMIR
ncbi:MAG: hypothetical protein FWC00_06265 [Firmicutes bacterium]|nr:hypothetical protein [Bacillota bacterium]